MAEKLDTILVAMKDLMWAAVQVDSMVDLTAALMFGMMVPMLVVW